MLKRAVMVMCAVAMSASGYAAQAKPAPTKSPATAEKAKPSENKAEPAAKAAPEVGQPVNIKIEVSITDQTGASTPAKKIVTMIAGDRQSTNIRSTASVPVKAMPGAPTTFMRDVTINVDARPVINQKEPNKISVNLGLEYFPKAQGSQEVMEAGMAQFSERLGLVLESGKSMVISQAADPTSDRKITVEVTATILK